jgi:arylsulfatase A
MVAAAALAACACSESAPRAPDVIVIVIDDLGVGDVGCYNPDSKIPTPRIDRLAAEGMRFDAAYAPAAICSPSRYALLTGRYAWRSPLKSQLVSRYDPLLIEPGTPTLPAVLREHGYATACIGKWHLGFGAQQPGDFGEPDPERRPQRADYTRPLRPGPNECGFEHFFGAAGKPGMYFVVPPERPQDELASWFVEDGVVQVGDRASWDQSRVGPILAQRAVEWIEARAGDERPFFLYFAPTAVHAPLHPAEFARGRSGAGEYGDFVFEADWAVGEVLDALERTGRAENALVIVTSDNGPDPSTAAASLSAGHRSNLALRGWKRDVWEGGVRVPLVVRWPGRVRAGSASDALAALDDLFPTCASAAGIELAHAASPDGFDLAHALTGASGATPPREELVLHSARGAFALRRGAWKYIAAPGSGGNAYPGEAPRGPVQLYDLARDPAEATNLAEAEPQHAAELAARLDALRRADRSRP